MSNVIVAGGFGALGRVVVEELRTRGHRVAVVDMAPVPESSDDLAIGGVDLADNEAVATAYAEAVRKLGSIDGLVNVAGGFTWEPVQGGSLDSFDAMYRMNLRTAAASCRAVLEHMTSGAIVNVGAAAATGPGFGMASYAASKAGVMALTESLAEELRGSGIRVNAVLPTILDTPANRNDMPDADTSGWVTPASAAKAIAFLLSDEAEAVTGAGIRLSLGGGGAQKLRMSGGISPADSNATGLVLGRKGRETRQRLMDAAFRLLAHTSPRDLTAIAIATEAGTAPATLYIYFRDVQDMLYALSESATADMLSAFAALDVFHDNGRVAADSEAFLAMLAEQWDRHGAILYYRMMEADRGEPRFAALRGRWAEAVLDRFARLLQQAPHLKPPLDEVDAYAESIVLFASIERLAGAIQREPKLRIPPERMRAAQARVLTRMIAPDGQGRPERLPRPLP